MGDNCPCLLISSLANQFLYDVAKNRCYDVGSCPELERKLVLASSSTDGWLVLTEFLLFIDCYLWNPKSGEKIQLPPLPEMHIYEAAVLTKPPTEPDCYIIFNSRTLESPYKQFYCKIGDAAFKTSEWRLRALRGSRGRIYGVLRHSLVSLEFVQEELEVRPMFELQGWSSADYLVASDDDDDELLLLRMRQPTFDLVHYRHFKAFRLHPEKMECVEVGSIGDKTVFVAEFGDALCCSSSANKTKANAVYYTRDGSRNLYIYSLDDGSTATVLPSTAAHRYSNPTWIHQHPAHQLLHKMNQIS